MNDRVIRYGEEGYEDYESCSMMKRLRIARYPFDRMDIGDMFKEKYSRVRHQSILNMLRYYKKKERNKDKDFRVVRDGKEIKVWRVV